MRRTRGPSTVRGDLGYALRLALLPLLLVATAALSSHMTCQALTDAKEARR